jgi:two-component system chemotaxis family response regulator WspR
MAARYGGKEFAVVLPRTPLAGALAVADRILTTVEANVGRQIGSGWYEAVTVSIGAASSGPHCPDAASLITLADSALYRAKRAGRNRVVPSAKDDCSVVTAAPFAA